MKTKPLLLCLLLLLSCLAISSCKKEKETKVDEAAFCTFVGNQNYEGTAPLIDAFLASLGNGSQEEQLIKLKDWMEAMTCVDSASILCNSCIETLPPQSELRVVFISGTHDTTLTMDILMSEPMKFRTFHE
jgi:hypothetical protein